MRLHDADVGPNGTSNPLSAGVLGTQNGNDAGVKDKRFVYLNDAFPINPVAGLHVVHIYNGKPGAGAVARMLRAACRQPDPDPNPEPDPDPDPNPDANPDPDPNPDPTRDPILTQHRLRPGRDTVALFASVSTFCRRANQRRERARRATSITNLVSLR